MSSDESSDEESSSSSVEEFTSTNEITDENGSELDRLKRECRAMVTLLKRLREEEEDLRDAILLVFANKQDQKGALNAQQISDALGLPEVRNRQWSIQETSALKGKGLFEGFDWLVTCIKGVEGE